jgi:hypothetical protein
MLFHPRPMDMESSTDCIAIDLSRLAARAAKASRFPGLVPAIEQAVGLASCAVDLEHAQQACDALERLETARRPTPDGEIIRKALLYSAVSHYIRATWSSAKKGERGSFAPKFRPPLDAWHREMRKLRNEALAHVRFDHDIAEGVWHAASLVLIDNGARSRVFSLAASADYDTGIAKMLRELIPAARVQIDEQEARSRQGAAEMLAQAIGDGIEVRPEDGVDLERLFGDPEQGARFLRALLE